MILLLILDRPTEEIENAMKTSEPESTMNGIFSTGIARAYIDKNIIWRPTIRLGLQE
jgi:hypothetical protein